ncbi:integral membrane protein [Patellaria atrata CBS 101060]|uniref:Integral membrane protein n=1 Tax=Patellaria atrata CBS 101060 TaxID=1346257 RepID=A0A9P4VQQ7_9PEZI|nr:integral membrane protein [Patellaria atrata CBS 101060]
MFGIFYILTLLLVRHYSWRDPTSVFFDPETAYDPIYSVVREKQAVEFMQQFHGFPGGNDKPGGKKICLGMASIARKGVRYFRAAVGSLLDGLDEIERSQIHLILFIAHTDPSVHPAYNESWLHDAADTVLLYDLDPDTLSHVRALETSGFTQEKALFDYNYLLQSCIATELPYIAMMEDDILALDGWFHRTRSALEMAESRSEKPFLYLRLFYTEQFLGWNSENWAIYFFWSLWTVLIPTSALLLIRRCAPNYHAMLSDRRIFMLTFVCIPLCILLFFAAGRATVLPIPAGVNQMNDFACCGQGLVFPQVKAQNLSRWYEMNLAYFDVRKNGLADMLTEEYAKEHEEVRWAITPNVIQHVGRKSTKQKDQSDRPHPLTEAEKMFNFKFELNDAGRLRREHERVLREMKAGK